MNEEQIETLLRQTDEAAVEPVFDRITATKIRQRVRRRRLLRAGIPAAAAVLVATGLWVTCMRTAKPQPQPQPQRLASLEEQVRQLRAQTDATLKLVQEVLQRDRQDRRLAALEAELAGIPDPMQEIDRQVDRTAFILLYQADRLYNELNQTESAVRAYKEIIRLFPENQWADVARERLSRIEQRQYNKSDDKGEAKCEPRKA
jgi:tetratricopeptide (TPR) repeat protein